MNGLIKHFCFLFCESVSWRSEVALSKKNVLLVSASLNFMLLICPEDFAFIDPCLNDLPLSCRSSRNCIVNLHILLICAYGYLSIYLLLSLYIYIHILLLATPWWAHICFSCIANNNNTQKPNTDKREIRVNHSAFFWGHIFSVISLERTNSLYSPVNKF